MLVLFSDIRNMYVLFRLCNYTTSTSFVCVCVCLFVCSSLSFGAVRFLLILTCGQKMITIICRNVVLKENSLAISCLIALHNSPSYIEV